MSAGRETILARIRASQQRVATGGANRISPLPLPEGEGKGEGVTDGALPVVGSDLAATFTERARKLSSDVLGPVPRERAASAVADYLAAHALPARAVCWPALSGINWAGAGIIAEARAARGDDLVGITGGFCAIAETGTLMLLSAPDTPASVSLLPETHVALLPVARLVARMEDAFALLRCGHGALPRAVNFVSGPSRTADIEQTVTLGAHGPYRVLIILISE